MDQEKQLLGVGQYILNNILTIPDHLFLLDIFNCELFLYSLLDGILVLVLLGKWKKLCISIIWFNECFLIEIKDKGKLNIDARISNFNKLKKKS